MEIYEKERSKECKYVSKSIEGWLKTFQHLLSAFRKKIQTSHIIKGLTSNLLKCGLTSKSSNCLHCSSIICISLCLCTWMSIYIKVLLCHYIIKLCLSSQTSLEVTSEQFSLILKFLKTWLRTLNTDFY